MTVVLDAPTARSTVSPALPPARAEVAGPAPLDATRQEILADDASERARPDLSLPLPVLLAPVLDALRGAAGSTESADPAEAADRGSALVADLADRGLLDAGVDALVASAQGYAGAAGAGAQGGLPTLDPAVLVAALARVCATSAATVAVQRAAIEVLAHARRTPANERLLKALRRGAVLVGMPAAGEPPLAGEALVDGSVLVQRGRVRLIGARPGGAVLLRVRLGERIVWAWTTYRSAGVVPFGAVARGGAADGTLGGELAFDRLVIRAEAVIDAPVREVDRLGLAVVDAAA